VKVLRSAYELAREPKRTGAVALAQIVGALVRRDGPTLGHALYAALMSGFTPAGLAKVVAPAAAVYAGVDSAPRFNKTLGQVIGCLNAAPDASPSAVRKALDEALVHPKFVPGAGGASLTELALQAIRADYDDEAFKKGGADAVCGAGDVMRPYTKFMNRTVFNDDGHDPAEATRRREAMILTILATKGDVQALAIHCYVALGVGLSPDEVREIFRAVGPPASAPMALSVFDAVLAILEPIVARQGPIMLPALGTILRTFLD
jgi:alkylhydroperoxidase/carboxymuconolactone decarboxylase family protein YurZ